MRCTDIDIQIPYCKLCQYTSNMSEVTYALVSEPVVEVTAFGVTDYCATNEASLLSNFQPNLPLTIVCKLNRKIALTMGNRYQCANGILNILETELQS